MHTQVVQVLNGSSVGTRIFPLYEVPERSERLE